MKLTIIAASALALLSSQTPASAQGHGAPYAQAPSATQVHVVPPPGRVVFVYDGPNLIGRFDREGWMSVWTGRSYGVVITRDNQQIWSGSVAANGPPIDLTWGGYGPGGAPGPQPYYQGPSTAPPPPAPYGCPNQPSR